MISLQPLRNLFRRNADCHCQDGDDGDKIRAIKAQEDAARLMNELAELNGIHDRERRYGGSL